MITPHGLNVGGDACIDGRERVSIVLIVGDTKNKRYVIRNRAILKQISWCIDFVSTSCFTSLPKSFQLKTDEELAEMKLRRQKEAREEEESKMKREEMRKQREEDHRKRNEERAVKKEENMQEEREQQTSDTINNGEL